MPSQLDKTPILECVVCERRHSQQDVADRKYFPKTHMCFLCYDVHRRAPYSVSCFGKIDQGPGKRGYDATAVECRMLCPDRRICPKFVSREIDMQHEMSEKDRKRALKLLYKSQQKPGKSKRPSRAHPFRPGSLAYDAFELCREGTTKKKVEALCNKDGGNAARLLRLFRREELYGFEWTWIEEGQAIRLRLSDKDNKAASKRKG